MVVGDLATEVDVLVLGAGPGGYTAAIRAAQLGLKTVVIDPRVPGGSCLHEACIPSKALVTAADKFWQTQTLGEMGIGVGQATLDWKQTQAWKGSIVERLVGGVQKLLDGNGVEFVKGRGWFIAQDEVRVEAEYGTKRFIFEKAIIATGARQRPLPGLPFDGKRIISAIEALQLETLPDRVTVVGADHIAAETATMFGKLGVATTLVIPPRETFLPDFEQAAGRLVQAQLRKIGVKLKRKLAEYEQAVKGAELIIACNGRMPHTDSLGLDQVGVELDESEFIIVNKQMQTSNPDVYAVGDIIGQWPLAVLAIKQGKVAAEAIAGLPVAYAPQAIPRIMWGDPEVAAVGLGNKEAEALGYEVVSGRFPFGANGRALMLNAGAGVVLTTAEAGSELLLGVTIIGPRASELIGEAALAIEMGATLTDLTETLHPHPGMAEALQESAEGALQKAIHVLNG